MCRQTSESISTLIRICYLFLLSSVLGLSSTTSLPTCSISAPFVGRWIQPGLVDLITINNTWCSLKGTCLTPIGQQDVKNKFIFYNEYVTSFILLSLFLSCDDIHLNCFISNDVNEQDYLFAHLYHNPDIYGDRMSSICIYRR